MRQYRICMTSQWGEQKETINALSWLTRDMADSGRHVYGLHQRTKSIRTP